jgi:adenylate cyclase class IV
MYLYSNARLEKEAKTVNEISIKSYKDKENHSRILDQSDFGSNGVIALSNYDFDHLT